MEPTSEDTALLVIDMQNTFCDDAGACARAGMPVEALKAVIEPCRRLIDAARGAGVPVIYTRYACRADYSDAGIFINLLNSRLKDVAGLVADTGDVDIVAALAPGADDPVIDRNRPSAFHDSELDATLRDRGVDKLVVCGVTTACCVESTVRDATQRDFQTCVVSDAVAEFDDANHRAALNAMGRLFAHLTTVNDVTLAWRREAA